MAKAQTEDHDDLAAMAVQTNAKIAAALEQLVAQAPPEEIGYGHPKYQQRLRDEEVFADFAVPVFQNGKQAQARGLKPETIDRVVLLRSGKYLGGRVEVLRDARDRVHLLYKHARIEDRMRFKALVADFDDLIAKIWAEMQAAA